MSMGLDMFLYILAHCYLASQIYQPQNNSQHVTGHGNSCLSSKCRSINVNVDVLVFVFFYNNQSYETETTKMSYLKAIK